MPYFIRDIFYTKISLVTDASNKSNNEMMFTMLWGYLIRNSIQQTRMPGKRSSDHVNINARVHTKNGNFEIQKLFILTTFMSAN